MKADILLVQRVKKSKYSEIILATQQELDRDFQVRANRRPKFALKGISLQNTLVMKFNKIFNPFVRLLWLTGHTAF